jgi:hypothetical protein
MFDSRDVNILISWSGKTLVRKFSHTLFFPIFSYFCNYFLFHTWFYKVCVHEIFGNTAVIAATATEYTKNSFVLLTCHHTPTDNDIQMKMKLFPILIVYNCNFTFLQFYTGYRYYHIE